MNKEKEVYDKSLKDYIDKLIIPIFDKVHRKSSNNPMMVGRVQKKEISFLWQPHNYRLYFYFNKTNFIPPTSKSIYKTRSKYELKNYGSEHHFYNWKDCKITIKKTMVEVINKSHNKQWRLITANSIPQIKKKIDQVVENLNKQGISALKSIIRRFGGISDCKIIKVRGEHGIHGIDYLDRIPEDMVIHDTIFKKVYKGKVEFYDPANIKNFVSNMALKDIAPEIAESIDNLGNQLILTIRSLDKSIKLEIENKKLHLEILNNIDKSFKRFNKLLSQTSLRKWL